MPGSLFRRAMVVPMLLAGCASSGYGVQHHGAAHTTPAGFAAHSVEPAANTTPAIDTPGARYSVEIQANSPGVQTVGATDRTSIIVRNTGPDIPALSLGFAGAGKDWKIRRVSSDRDPRPAEARIDNGRGWQFGPLPHGAVTHVTVELAPLQSGQRTLRIRGYAVAEDEGDSLLSVDRPIPGADRAMIVNVRPAGVAARA